MPLLRWAMQSSVVTFSFVFIGVSLLYFSILFVDSFHQCVKDWSFRCSIGESTKSCISQGFFTRNPKDCANYIVLSRHIVKLFDSSRALWTIGLLGFVRSRTWRILLGVLIQYCSNSGTLIVMLCLHLLFSRKTMFIFLALNEEQRANVFGICLLNSCTL